MKPLGAFLATLAVALLLRSTALSSLAARGVIVDVLAFATVAWALRHGDSWGSTLGFTLGLAADLDAAHWFGRHALGLSLIGYGIGRLSTTLVRDSARTQFAMIALSTALHQVWIAIFEVGGVGSLPYLLIRATVATALTASLGTLVLVLLRRIVGRPLFGYASRTPASD